MDEFTILVLEPEETCVTAVNWLMWMSVMVCFVILLLWITGVSKEKKCDFDSTYSTERPRPRGVHTY
jgi:hypothetical protein